MRRSLLCISYRFPPETYPLTARVKSILSHLEGEWDITAMTAANPAKAGEDIEIHHVKPIRLDVIVKFMRRFRLTKFIDWLFWPDPYALWVWPAFFRALRLIREKKPDMILLFMMPYSTGRLGLMLKRWTGLPLVFNLDDSATCTDMNPSFPSRWHYRRTERMENRYMRGADASIFVSRRNTIRVRDRQDSSVQPNIHLVRWGGKKQEPAAEALDGPFQIVYTGGMSGWYKFLDRQKSGSFFKRMYEAWMRMGRLRLVELDHRSHSPVFIGDAIKKVTAKHPEWEGRIQLGVYGNRYPDHVVNRVLKSHDIDGIVQVNPPVPHEEALRLSKEAHLLFIALPDRKDGSPGGRISAKTYEYLMTDRPILAAVPNGENREFLQDKPGVEVVTPRDVEGMARVIEHWAARHFQAESVRVNRTAVYEEISAATRARDFAAILDTIVPPPASNGAAPSFAEADVLPAKQD